MNKRALIETITSDAGLDPRAAEAALNAAVSTISAALVAGESVAIPGFGIFETRTRAARTGRNPQTGETMEIAAARVPAFKPASALKAAVRAG